MSDDIKRNASSSLLGVVVQQSQSPKLRYDGIVMAQGTSANGIKLVEACTVVLFYQSRCSEMLAIFYGISKVHGVGLAVVAIMPTGCIGFADLAAVGMAGAVVARAAWLRGVVLGTEVVTDGSTVKGPVMEVVDQGWHDGWLSLSMLSHGGMQVGAGFGVGESPMGRKKDKVDDYERQEGQGECHYDDLYAREETWGTAGVMTASKQAHMGG